MGSGNFRAGTDLYDDHAMLVLREDSPDAGVYVGGEEIRGYIRQSYSIGWRRPIEAEEIVEAGARAAPAAGARQRRLVDMRYWQVWTVRGTA